VSRLIAGLGLGATVEYLGKVEGEEKAAAYRAADLFVLPSFSENFGVVVAEALAYGLPVITSRATPWAELEAHACGWWIDTGVKPLAEGLRAATCLDDAERRAMGARGRLLAQRYDWDRIATQTLGLYRWLLGDGVRPECVLVE
jgi:glycosyltransferase involved in cell wall biosynthesis